MWTCGCFSQALPQKWFLIRPRHTWVCKTVYNYLGCFCGSLLFRGAWAESRSKEVDDFISWIKSSGLLCVQRSKMFNSTLTTVWSTACSTFWLLPLGAPLKLFSSLLAPLCLRFSRSSSQTDAVASALPCFFCFSSSSHLESFHVSWAWKKIHISSCLSESIHLWHLQVIWHTESFTLWSVWLKWS